MTHLSLFTGVGGFDLGFEMAGFETVAQVENDRYANLVLSEHWPDVPKYEDICDFNGREWEGVDVITGGFPCQDLSVAGKRKGLSGARSGLFFQLARVVEEARPRLLLWENVPGLLSADERGAMGTVLGELANLGYSGCWRVLDSQFHGVPQVRRRVFGAFAPGSAGGWACGAAVLLEPEGSGWNPAEGGGEGAGVAGGAPCGTLESRWRESADSAAAGHFIPEVSFACTARDAKGVSQREGVTTLIATYYEHQFGGWREGFGTLRSQQRSHVVSGGAQGVRRLTPLETERLQGFPDGWTDVAGMSDTQRYRQLGNAVSVPVIYWIALRTKMALSQ